MKFSNEKLRKGRETCPKCGAKGLGFSAHAHAIGHQDLKRVKCRYCGASFKKNAESSEVLG